MTHVEPDQWQPVAAVLAVLIPGLGHAYLGETRRGAYIALGVLGLFFGGLLIGGIDTVDRKEDKVWFFGQALVGPIAFGVDAVHQNFFKGYEPSALRSTADLAKAKKRNPNPDETIRVETVPLTSGASPVASGVSVRVLRPAGPGERPPLTTSLGRVNEIGTLYSTIAGMLNLIVIIDAAYRGRRRKGVA
jgi:TM2 domain-containing membrane protein YozV